MKKIAYVILFVAVLSVLAASGYAQETEISGQFRPRYEMRNGFNTLKPDGVQPANFISQRSRLNLKYTSDLFDVGFSIQNIGVWGESASTRMSDVNGTMVHEAWASLAINKKVSLKLGRQMFVYDDHRIFGSLDWAQQARSHDAALLTIRPRENCKFDIGFAYNANKQSLFKENYAVNQYKALQFVHWHRDFTNLGVSVLILNNGMPWIDATDTTDSGTAREKVAYSQTIGTRLTYKKEKFSANGAFYLQTGKVTRDTTGNGIMESTKDFSAIYFMLDASYQVANNFLLGAGVEYLSGNSMKDPSDKDQAFKPLYGTNHKFNGLMDYFYVGNHMNSVGLMDIFVVLKYSKDKFSAALIPHMFQSAGDIYAKNAEGNFQDYSSGLGTEIDLVFSYNVAKNVSLKAGYSQMFASESMQVLKGGNHENTNNWAWVMIDFKPTFFKSNKNN